MSALTGRLSEEDLRELARLIRGIHARAAARRERERQDTDPPPLDGEDTGPGRGDHDDTQ